MEKKREITRMFTLKTAKILVFFSFIFVIFGVSSRVAEAASLYFSPSSGSYAVGSAVTASVYVSSADQAMNAASGVISFPQDKLEVTSLSKSGSIFSLWVQEPSFSNSAGTVNFEGIVLNPGFTGTSGKIITINFRVKAAGTALINFFSGSALANDGKGTNILASLGKAELSLGGATPKVSGLPSAPAISSPTHPDPNKWYANKNPKFEWTLPAGVNGVNVLADRASNTNPGIKSDGLMSTYTYKDVDEGVWYFHLRFRNANGWGETSHFRFQIDTASPEPFLIEFLDGKETVKSQPRVAFSTKDKLSGLAGYQMKIDKGDWFDPQILKTGSYVLPHQAPGERQLLVRALDKAGNAQEAGDKFVILPARELLPLPVISFPMILFGILLLAALALVGYLMYRLRKLKRNVFRETRKAGSALHKAFDSLKENIREQVKMLEKTRTKRQLTEEEEKIVKHLKKDLDDAEKFVKKEIEDIEKEVK